MDNFKLELINIKIFQRVNNKFYTFKLKSL